jgi:hypothetical protein
MLGIDSSRFAILSGTHSRPPSPCWRNDAVYIQKLTSLIKLRDFIYREAIVIKSEDQDKLEFGINNSLSYNRKGVVVSPPDWAFLEERTRVLMSYMTPDSLRRIELLFAPKALFWVPILLAVVSALALAMSVFPPNSSLLDLWSQFLALFGATSAFPPAASDQGLHVHLQSWRLSGFLFWGTSLGAIGAISFVYVNALSIQIDKNVDVTNKNFVTMRIILGALFGVVLDLPLGYPGVVKFCTNLAEYDAAAQSKSETDITGGALLLLPFLIGFSAPLMINILNRLVDAIQNLFGIRSEGPPAPLPKPP